MSLNTRKTSVIIGECESCNRNPEPVQLYQLEGGIMGCEQCRDMQPVQSSKPILQDAREKDAKIIDSADIMNAGTVAITEMKFAIDNDDTILPSDKRKTLIAEIAARMDTFSKAIFDMKADLVNLENGRLTLRINLQEMVSEERNRGNKEDADKYAKFLVDYPQTSSKGKKPSGKSPKSVSTKSDTSASEFKRNEFNEVCEKYNVNKAFTRQIMITRNVNAEAAAKIALEIVASAKATETK